MSPALEAIGLTKQFGQTTAADLFSLVVPAGSTFGLVGPNGAGKTTAIAMAVGLLRPDGGTARIFGHDVWSHPAAALNLVGVLPEGLAFPEWLSARELLIYYGLLRGIERAVVVQRTDELIAILELESVAGEPVIDYSTGMRKQIGLAAALLHIPRLLVLDEPFENVDPVSATTIRSILERFRNAGGTIIMSSHSMPLVESLCDHVAVINDGRVLAAGTMGRVLGGESLDAVFVRLVGSRPLERGDLAWLST